MRILNFIILGVMLFSGGEALAGALCFDNVPLEEKRRLQALDEATAQKSKIDYVRWLAAMPESIRPHWQKMTADPDWFWEFERDKEETLSVFRQALQAEFPNQDQCILAFYAWYGSGSGYWSGYPIYEIPAEDLLLAYSTADLVGAAQSVNLSETQAEGAARLFASWDFRRDRPDDNKLLPLELKAKLLEHSLKTAINDDKRERAERAFGIEK